MSPSRKRSEITFSRPPPAHVKVNKSFKVIIQAPSGGNNGDMGYLSLYRVSSRSGDLTLAPELIGGEPVGNWDLRRSTSNGRDVDTMEFKIKVTQAGSYHIRIHIYGPPAIGGGRDDFSVEHIKDLDSAKFHVGE
ncbi:uncharacterized protein F4822DRAFT_425855 [Hypoxylon trugodes]|uniref:uncharacterized protein n=1 Tax=Hypoxylon trugodes TaxID=326681 RepID=UPI00218F0664|nr:uncharacterized protein F4822DRAFT_425855 [Hypoxylon trugodes]KAI1392653.1 hypothetical protein F4822DRAFT_425855 [Hypoxylon trugodes]